MSGPFLPTMGSILGLPAPAAQPNPKSFIVLGQPLSTAEIAEWTFPTRSPPVGTPQTRITTSAGALFSGP